MPRHGRTTAQQRRGFSLMEVLVSIALLLALFGAMFGFLFDMLATRQRVLEFTAQQRAAALLINRIESDLLTCLVGDQANGAGVVGDEFSLTLLTRGAASGMALQQGDEVLFTDLIKSSYQFDPDRHTLTATRSAAAGSSQQQSHELGTNLYKVRFRFHDGSDWLTQFDSLERDRLPLAVEVAIWFDPWPGEDWSELAFKEDQPELAEPERLTFDMQGTFDEQQWAMRADRDGEDEPTPDRIRVIVVPDSQEPSP